MKTLRLHKFIAITLCVTLLTVSASRVTRVSAVGTSTAVIAGTAFILTGAVYLSYIALTNGQVAMPLADDMHEWLGDIGRKVSQYPSGSEAYQDIYQQLAYQRDPIAVAIDGVWTWTQDRLKSFANDFSDTRLIQDIVSYTTEVDVSQEAYNGFNYPFTFVPLEDYVFYYNVSGTMNLPISVFEAAYHCNFLYYDGAAYAKRIDSTHYSIIHTNIHNPVRNYLKSNGKYIAQQYIDGVWTLIGSLNNASGVVDFQNEADKYFSGTDSNNRYGYAVSNGYTDTLGESTYPYFPQDAIYVESTGETLPVVVPNSEVVTRTPQWLTPNNDNENRPIIPWVPIPDIPTGVPTPPGYTGPPQWGFPLQDLLDLLESLSELLMEIGMIGELINQFAGQHGDNYYLEYNDGDTNYYTYYNNTVFDNDNEYITYNIDVSDVDEHLPVDLNTIQLYTQNRYLDEVKRSAVAGSSIIRDLVVFVYDIDPGIVYVFFGSCIAILVAAFIGKWGHS